MSERERDRDLPPALRDALDRLPKSVEPPADLWPGIRDRIRKREWGVGSGSSLRRWIPLALAAILLLAVGIVMVPRWSGETWAVQRVAGAPRVNDAALGARGTLRVGQWLETDDSSRATLAIAGIGWVDVRPGTRLQLVRSRATDHRLALAFGAIHAKVDAPPRLFYVDTPVGTATDLGCEYTLESDSSGRGLLHVTGGYVELEWLGVTSIVPFDAYAETRPGSGPGVPYVEDAPAALKAALASFSFDSGGAAATREALRAARPGDAVSLWHLLARVDGTLRGEVYDRLAVLVPPPAGVTRARALALDPEAMDRYWTLLTRIHFRISILQGIREIDPRTGRADGRRR